MATGDEKKCAEMALRIAEVKFTHALKREDGSQQDIPPVPLDLGASLFEKINAVLQRNSTANIQVSTK